MTSLDQILQDAIDQRLIQNLDESGLRESLKLLEELSADIRNRLLALKPPESEEEDSDYITVVISGQRDRIKKDIEVLNISCNDFKRLPDEIYQLKNLKKLFLYNNKFTPEEKKQIRQQFNQKVQIFF